MLKHASGYLALVPVFGCCEYYGYQHSFTVFGWMFILNFESIYQRMELLGHVVIQNCGGNSVKILASSTGRTGTDIIVVPWGAQMAWPLYLCCCCLRAASGRHVLLGNMIAA